MEDMRIGQGNYIPEEDVESQDMYEKKH